MSFCFFRPALNVPLGGRVDVASLWGKALCTVVPAPGAILPTVVDWRLQVLVFGPSGRNGAGSASASTALSSTAAPAGVLRLEGSDELYVHGYKLCREPLDHGR